VGPSAHVDARWGRATAHATMDARRRGKRAREDANGANGASGAGDGDGRRVDAADEGADDAGASNDDGDEEAGERAARARGDAAARSTDETRGRNAPSPGSAKTRDMRAHFRKATSARALERAAARAQEED